MAIGVAAQFEMLLRQKDIIGEWPPSQADVDREAARMKVEPRRYGQACWIGQFTWERIPG
jgi:hypothetical protein